MSFAALCCKAISSEECCL